MTQVTFCRGTGLGKWRNKHTPGQGKGPADEVDNGLERVGGVGGGEGGSDQMVFSRETAGLITLKVL